MVAIEKCKLALLYILYFHSMFMGLLSLPSYESRKLKGQVTTFKNGHKNSQKVVL